MAGITLFTGNRLEHLAATLAEQWRRQPLPPLEKEVAIVQSRGMERWLNLQLADRLGVCANLDCVLSAPIWTAFSPNHLSFNYFRRFSGRRRRIFLRPNH